MTAPVPPELVERIRELRYVDGLSRPAIQRLTGVNPKTQRRHAPGKYVGKVPNGPVRDAFLATNRSACSVAREVGFVTKRGGDGSRLLRTLGLRDEKSGHRNNRHRRRMIDAEVAQSIAEACGVAGWSVLPEDESDVAW